MAIFPEADRGQPNARDEHDEYQEFCREEDERMKGSPYFLGGGALASLEEWRRQQVKEA